MQDIFRMNRSLVSVPRLLFYLSSHIYRGNFLPKSVKCVRERRGINQMCKRILSYFKKLQLLFEFLK